MPLAGTAAPPAEALSSQAPPILERLLRLPDPLPRELRWRRRGIVLLAGGLVMSALAVVRLVHKSPGVWAAPLVSTSDELGDEPIDYADQGALPALQVGMPIPFGMAAPRASFVDAARSPTRAVRSRVSTTTLTAVPLARSPALPTAEMAASAIAEASMANEATESPADETASHLQQGSPGGNTGSNTGSNTGGDLYGARIRYVIQRYYAARVAACLRDTHDGALASPSGMVMAMKIDGDGKPLQSWIVPDGADRNQQTEHCLLSQSRRWQLPPPPLGQPMVMQIPFFQRR